MNKAAKPGLAELIGMAVNSSSLEMSETHERAIERIAAVGGASNRIATGADLAGLPVAAMDPALHRRSADMRQVMLDPGLPDPRDIIAGELCPMLWHIREGGQHELLPKAIRLFARWMQSRRTFAGWDTQAHVDLLERFSAWVMHEWLSSTCLRCGGCGKLERTRAGTFVRPRGSMARNAMFRACDTCNGNGRAVPSHTERARWLEIPMNWYDSERWGQRFNAAHSWLERILHARMHRPLTAELERRRKHS